MDKQRKIEEPKINLELSLGIIESDKATTSPIFDEQRIQRLTEKNLLEQQRELFSLCHENRKLMSNHCQLQKECRAHLKKLSRLREKRPYEVKEDYQNNLNYQKKRRVDAIIDTENKFIEKVVPDEEGTKEVSLRINNKKLVLGNNDNGIRIEKDNVQEFDANGGLEKVPNLTNNVPNSNNLSTDQTSPHKVRFAVRTRSQGPMISDGCSWRKYGQKIPKGSPHPKAYYRCTMVKKCPVVKTVQKCAEDETIEVTTYREKHNHLLPPTGKMMGKATSLAESMILTDSKSSADELNSIFPGLSKMATLSPSGPYPTINLDLTNLPNYNPLQQNPLPQTEPNLTSLISQSMISGLQTSTPTPTPTLNAAPLQSRDQNATVNDTDLSAITTALISDPNFITSIATAVVSLIFGFDTLKGNNSVEGNASSSGTVTSDDHA